MQKFLHDDVHESTEFEPQIQMTYHEFNLHYNEELLKTFKEVVGNLIESFKMTDYQIYILHEHKLKIMARKDGEDYLFIAYLRECTNFGDDTTWRYSLFMAKGKKSIAGVEI